MCGIYGVFAPLAHLAAAERSLPTALTALHHRGPDDRGQAVFVGPTHGVAFAQARLAIIDLSPAGHQPMATPDGRYLLLLNGEIYNHRDLRRLVPDYPFRGDSDTETALALFTRFSVATALGHFIGMFALALFDRDTQTLTLARDRLGKKPLYLVDHPHGLAFASEVRALLATGAAPRALDPRGLALFLARGSARDPHTLIQNVRSLRPGHLLIATPHGVRETPYWRLPDGGIIDWRERLPELLEDATRLRLISDRPLGVFLSGGVDSTAIAALASRHVKDQLDTFTLTFDEGDYDESERATALANHLGVRHHAAHLTSADAVAAIDDALAAQDLPSHDGFNTWFITRAARQHLVVALAGTGGDELFGGYPHFQTFDRYLAIGRAARLLPRPLRHALASSLTPHLPTRLHKAASLITTEGDPARLYQIVRELFAPAQIHRLIGASPPSPDLASQTPSLTHLELHGYLVDTQLRDVDVMSMAHGFEVRAPLLDHRLVELMAHVPTAHKNPPGPINKRLLVRAAGLPDALFTAKKRGFVLPWEQWLRGPLTGWVDRHLDPASLREIGVLDERAVADVRRAFVRGHVNYSRILTLVALQSFLVRHGLRF